MDTTRTTGPARLLYDVLLIVASFADRQTLLRLLTTSRALHSDCGKYIFQDAVTLQGDRAIVSFIQFMQPYNLKRWRHLDSLRLSHKPISPLTAEELSKFIPCASGLRYLEFEDAEETLGTHPDLAPAFAALRTVKHIHIVYGNQHTCRMLEAMHWPLESAALRHITFKPAGLPDQDLLDRIHPATLLKNARTTLKHLDYHDWGGRVPLLHTYPVYPKLESLSVTSVPCPCAAQWAVSYPALKRVIVQTFDSIFLGMDEALLAKQTTARLRNMNELATQGQPWGELESLRGSLLDLYILGFTCRIRDLWLLDTPIDMLPFFAPVMATARPTDLTLSMSIGLIHTPPTYLHDPGLADLKSLTLDVTAWVDGSDGNEGDVDIDIFLGHVLDLLRRASVRRFMLYLNVQRANSREQHSILSTDAPESGDSEAVPLFALETWAKDADLEALAQHFLEEVASLEFVELSTLPSPSSIRRFVELSRVRATSSPFHGSDAPGPSAAAGTVVSAPESS